MKHRRLKSVPPRTKTELTTVHDRQATQLPAHAEIAVGLRQDPYDPANRISVALSLKGDPLLSLHARGFIQDYQFAAGRAWQRYYEVAQDGGLRSHAAIEPVDGGGFKADRLPETRLKAIAKLTYCRAILGETGNQLITLILGQNLPIYQAALTKGLTTKREIEFCGNRFREALSDLAKVFGYA